MNKHLKKALSTTLAVSMLIPAIPFANSGIENVVNAVEIDTSKTICYDFEKSTDIDSFVNVKSDLFEISSEQNNTPDGSNSLKIGRDICKYQVDLKLNPEEPLVGKKVSFDVYIPEVNKRGNYFLELQGYGEAQEVSKHIYVGTIFNGSFNPDGQGYFYRYTNDSGFNKQESVLTQPKQGWNTFTVDYSQKGEVSIYANGNLLKQFQTTDGEFGGFSKMSLIDQATWDSHDANTPDYLYIDNVKIETPVMIASNLVIDDVNNTLEWKNYDGALNPTDYEYTVDGGQNYKQCFSNPQKVGNITAESGNIGIRVKNASENPNPTLYCEDELTFTVDTTMTFEDDSDLAVFSSPNGTRFQLSTDYARSGISSMLVEPSLTPYNPEGTATIQYQTILNQYVGEEKVTGKVVNMWVYDEMTFDRGFLVEPYIQETVNNDKFGLGLVSSTTNKTKYYYRVWSEGGQKETDASSRYEGWHKYTWDYSNGSTVKMYIDDEFVIEKETTGFDIIEYFDGWSSSLGNRRYIDDITISDTNTTVEVADAPTNPVNDDINDTFGFTPVKGKEDVSLYEYSYDFGKTFQGVKTNPIQLPDESMEVGQVLVRLKADGDNLAGQSLKNDEEFTPPDYYYLSLLEEKIAKAKTFRQGDYTEESWTDILNAIESAENTLAEKTGYKVEFNKFEEVLANVDQILDDYVAYDFEVDDGTLPFVAINGTLNKTGAAVVEPDIYVPYDTQNGALLKGVNGKAKAEYAFAQSLSDKYVQMVVKGNSAYTRFSLVDENGNKVGLQVGADLRIYSEIDGVFASVDSNFDKKATNHLVTWDFTNSKKGVIMWIDNKEITEIPGITSFDTMSVEYYGSSSSQAIAFDKIRIMEKNPTSSVEIADEEVTIGYYDTYDCPKPTLKFETLTDEYDTTDTVSYKSDSDCVHITSTGSIEAMSDGVANVTVTTSSGFSDTIKVNVEYAKSESMIITDAFISDIIAEGKIGQDTNNSDPIEKVEVIELQPGESDVLNALITPRHVAEKHVEWISSDENIFHVKDGLVTGINEGEAILKIKSLDGTNATDSCKIIVRPHQATNQISLYVAKDGDDFDADGSMGKPFATLERARDEVRTICSLIPVGGATVYVREGKYIIPESLVFDDQDSGTEIAPIRYEAYGDEKVTLMGGISYTTEDMNKVESSDKMYNRLPESSRDSVYKIDMDGITPRDLQTLGHGAFLIKDLVAEHGFYEDINYFNPYFSVYFNDKPMTLSRFPNEQGDVNTDFIQVSSVSHMGLTARPWFPDLIALGTGYEYEPGMEKDTFKIKSNGISAEQIKAWQASVDEENHRGIWLYGYWNSVFSDMTLPVKSIADDGTIESSIVTLYGVKNGNDFYAYNLIEELDIEGEWYIDESDPENLALYVFPPKGTDMSASENVVSVPLLEDVMLDMIESDYITFSGIDFNSTDNGVMNVTGGKHNVIENSQIANVNGKLSTIQNSDEEIARYNGFNMCDIKNIDGGVSLLAGDRDTLERGYNFVENCTFTTFSLRTKSLNPAVDLLGVGNRTSNCTFADAPHNAIQMGTTSDISCVEGVVEFCEIFDVMKSCGDQGAIYTGRDTLNRGLVIRNTYFHQLVNTTNVVNSGIFLDDGRGGVAIWDNVIEGVKHGVKSSGGRDIDYWDNKFINCEKGISGNIAYANGLSTSHKGLKLVLPTTTVDWQSENSPWRRFDHQYYILDDYIGASKYVSIINNEFINISNYVPHDYSEENICDNNVWIQDLGVGDYTFQRETMDDWYFVKGNELSQVGLDKIQIPDDAEYLVDYTVTTGVGSGEGLVFGDRVDLIKTIETNVRAIPAQGYEFSHWVDENGNKVSENATYFFTITNENVELNAVFTQK